MATTPRKSRSKSTPRKGGAGRRSGTPVRTAVEGGAGKADTPETAARPSATEGPAPASLQPAETFGGAGDGAEAPSLAKRDLFARVAAATGSRKKDVKLIAEATLAIIGQALSDGEELNLPPLGKVRIVKSRDAGAAEVVTLKLRRKHGMGGMPVPDTDNDTDEED